MNRTATLDSPASTLYFMISPSRSNTSTSSSKQSASLKMLSPSFNCDKDHRFASLHNLLLRLQLPGFGTSRSLRHLDARLTAGLALSARLCERATISAMSALVAHAARLVPISAQAARLTIAVVTHAERLTTILERVSLLSLVRLLGRARLPTR